MSALVETPAPIDVGVRTVRFALPKAIRPSTVLLWPLLVAIVGATAFDIVRPNVGDLQAALARQSAASNGVGLTYWFTWFGGGSTPGNYSVLTPYLSSFIGAPLVGALATIAITPLAYRALAGLPYRLAGTWAATFTAGFNLWSGRIPFALGLAIAAIALIGVRERRPALALLCIVVSSLCSPVTGAFLAFGLACAFLVEPQYRKLIFWVCAACGATLLVVAFVFGNPGPQGYSAGSAALTAGSALAMLAAKPAASLRVVLWCTVIAAPVLTVFPNGMGSNFVRLPWICLPAAVVATASARRLHKVLGLLPALALCANATIIDLVHSSQPSASASYYHSLIDQLGGISGLQNYRLEVVTDPRIHTAAYALVGHAALAGGYETQESNHLNAILTEPARLNAITYKIWLENNAVGYVAFDERADSDSAEYRLVSAKTPSYLTKISADGKWTLYRVENSTPIVPAPERLVSATQAQMTIQVPCACAFALRVRYSKFLEASTLVNGHVAKIANDGAGWTVVTTPAAGTYVLDGDVSRPLH